jgi:hypothetical protein
MEPELHKKLMKESEKPFYADPLLWFLYDWLILCCGYRTWWSLDRLRREGEEGAVGLVLALRTVLPPVTPVAAAYR